MGGEKGHPFPIVGIGASAGGLNALTQLISALPSRPGLALVIIQHLDPHHESRLAGLLQPHTSMTVTDAAAGTKIERDHAYVIQPNTNVALSDGILSVTPRSDERRPHYPVDHFLRSLAAVQGPRAIGVILSGTGSDGTLGVSEIRAAGGVTFAQDEHSAQHAGMPQSAIASGAIDLVLPPEEIAARLTTLPQHPYLNGGSATEPEAAKQPDEFQAVIGALRRTSGVDFSQYRDTTIKRRTARRMLLRGFSSPQQYAQFLERDRAEAEALYRDVLINVTSFFRDAEMFEELKREVFPALVSRTAEHAAIRVWVTACSTGQEAYSIAIALLEHLEATKAPRSIQIFATDLGDPLALDKARAGIYPESIEAEVSPERLRRFFVKEEHGYRILKQVRDLCVFARQNITSDPPFSHVDLVTCRNVLIYMSPALQERLLPVFHFALNPGGFLVLGLSETVGRHTDLFALVNPAHKIYARKESPRRSQLTFTTQDWLSGAPFPHSPPVYQPFVDLQREADRLALGRYAPPSVLLDANFEILHYRGRTTPYLEAPDGQPTTNILRMAREGLFLELRSALTEAKTTKAPVVREHRRTNFAGDEIEFTLRVVPVTSTQNSEGGFLLFFESKEWPTWSVPPPEAEHASPQEESDSAWLRRELASSKQYLQAVIEQHEVADQELRATHEEVLSSNEELQSTNEELETTKEELQSTNEELISVNEQLQLRNRELDALTDDLSNFISSAGLPMVTVGRDLCVRRLTPAAEETFNLLPTDVGRSIEHIKFSLAIDDIARVIEQVITTVQPWEHEVTDRDGRWWVVRVRPFQTGDGRIDGATVVAIDIDVLKRSHELTEARDYAMAIVQTVREPLVVLDTECRVQLANQAFYELFGETNDHSVRRLLWDTSYGVWNEPGVRRAITTACERSTPLVNLEIERLLPLRGRRVLVLNARSIVREGRPQMLLLAVEDVTDSRQAEALRIDAETLRLLDRRKDEFLGILAHELRNPLAPMRFALEVLRRAEASGSDTTKARQVLDRQIKHMVRIVDDLLDVSRITQGKVELRKEWLDLSSVVQGAVELSRPSLDAARQTFTLSLPDEPVTLHADPVRLTQIISNVLNNAIKFTPAGGHIWLIAEKAGESIDQPDKLRLRIRDTGIGIPPEMMSHVFDMFMQGDRSLERTRGGLGVGLTLVRNLVALHGGSIEAQSEGVGAGSEFTIVLPLDPKAQPAEATADAPAAARSTRPLRILVADDHEDGREMLRAFLTMEGHTVMTASDGTTAIGVAADFKPDVAILDIGMPHLNGYQVAERLRQASPKPPVLVALSGLARDEDKTRAVQAGFDRHFTKPVEIAALLAFLATVPAAGDSPPH